MPFLRNPSLLHWTQHARMKMQYYRLSPARVRRVLHSPRRTEEGVAPKTIAMMQPASLKSAAGRGGASNKETWNQEIWVMVQDTAKTRTVISAWRYPGVTKPRGEVATAFLQEEYKEFLSRGNR